MKVINLLAILVLFLSVGCAKPVFDVASKNKALGNTVFGENDGDNNDHNDDHNTGENDNIGNPPWNTREADWDHYHGGDTIKTRLVCSNRDTEEVGYNLSSAEKLELRLVDRSGNVVCKNTNTAQIKSQIVDQKTLVVPTCSGANDLKYAIQLVDPTKTYKNKDLFNHRSQRTFVVREAVGSSWAIILRKNQDDPKDYVEVLFNANEREIEGCDKKASPLIIKTVMEDYRGIELTSQDKGIDFDILGENSMPYAHAKKRISWLTKESYQFLVKPNKRGQVLGINEMFGDNTKGPDGKFADHGYHALSKYDLNKDRIIDSKDAVYKELALWSDKNFDGISQKDELVSLKKAGVEAIDLDFDGRYLETDQYGNQTTMKSVVKYSGDDENYRLIFDLWFKYEDTMVRTPDVRLPKLPNIKLPKEIRNPIGGDVRLPKDVRRPKTPNIPRTPIQRFGN